MDTADDDYYCTPTPNTSNTLQNSTASRPLSCIAYGYGLLWAYAKLFHFNTDNQKIYPMTMVWWCMTCDKMIGGDQWI